MRIFRLRYKQLGGHYHCRLFSGMQGGTFAKLGDLVLDEKDFAMMQGLAKYAPSYLHILAEET